MNKKFINNSLFFFFFLSGMCALIYEIVWLRVLGLIFGNTTYATSTVIAGYMAGLGFGAFFFGKYINQRKEPIKIYGFLEGGIAFYSFLTPLIWKLINHLNILFHHWVNPSFFQASIFKFVVAFLALLIPTFLMGGTLPVLSRYFAPQNERASKAVGFLYAINTFGAVAGVFLSGFVLLEKVGVWQSLVIAGLVNLLIALICLLGLNQSGLCDSAEPFVLLGEEKALGQNGQNLKNRELFQTMLLFLFALSGAASMMYEIGWTRILAVALGSSVYAFSVMLATFLSGIALGSYLFSAFLKGKQFSLFAFSILQTLTAIFVLVGINYFNDMPFYFVKVYAWSKDSVWLIELGRFVLCSFVMLLPTICIGAMFVCFIDIYRKSSLVAREVGAAYFANTLGCILGSFLTGFFLISAIGIQMTLVSAAQINLLVGMAAFLLPSQNFKFLRMVFSGFVCVLLASSPALAKPWDASILASGAMVAPFKLIHVDKTEFRKAYAARQTLYYKEGASSVVNVIRMQDQISIAVNGKVDASNADDAFNQFLLGHLPLFLNSNAQKVLVIGLGSGSTLAAVAAHPVREIDVIEIEKAVVEGAKFFSRLNRNVLQDPRVRISINDGRNFLLVHPDQYDVIISEPSNPWMAGVANLFSKEHYQLMLNRLNPGGVACQWLHAYSMSPEDLKMIIGTFKSVFENVSLWTSYYPDLLLIGTREPQVFDFHRIEELWKNPVIRQDFSQFGIKELEGFFANYWLGDEEIKKLVSGARINEDNFPYLEFSAPRSLYQKTIQANFLLVNSYRNGKYPSIENFGSDISSNQKFHLALVKGYLEKFMFTEAQAEIEIAGKLDSQNPDFILCAGLFNFRSEHFDEALVFLKKAVRVNPDSGEAHFYLGKTLKRKELLNEAIDELGKAVTLEPTNMEYAMELANSLSEARQLVKALYLYDKILTLDTHGLKGRQFEAMNKMADIIFEVGDLDKKVSIANQLIDRYPNYFDSYMKLGQLFEFQHLYDQAVLIYQKAVEKFPYEPRSFLNLVRVYDQTGKVADSKYVLKQLIHLKPELLKNTKFMEAMNR